MIDEEAARAIAAEAAAHAYRDLSGYAVSARLEGGSWYVDYELSGKGMVGGGPHFVIDAETGEITARRYEQ